MAETKYEMLQAEKPKAPPIDLVRISGDRNLTASSEAFGPKSFNSNVAEMQKQYSHPQTGEVITLREPTTVDSIFAASYDFANRAKPRIFDPSGLQAGRVLKTKEGVFVNVPRDSQGKPIIDEQILKSFLKANKKVNGIYLMNNDFGFVPYETFEQGVQEAGKFIEGGLARGLEHSQLPKHLKKIASEENYPNGVTVWGFDPVNEPALRVASLGSAWVSRRLYVLGGNWLDSYYGFAFGVLDRAEGAAKKFK